MTFWLFAYAFLGIAPFVQLRFGQDTDTTASVNHDLDWEASGAILIGCVVMLLGVALGQIQRKSHRSMQSATPEARPRASIPNHRAVTLLTVITLGIFGYYASRVGFMQLFSSRMTLDSIRSRIWPDSTTAAIFTALTQMGLLVCVVAQIFLRRIDTGYSRRVVPSLLFIVSLISLVISTNPISSARYIFGTAALALVTSYGAVSSVRRFRIFSITSLVGMIYVFPIADMFRWSLSPTVKSQSPLTSMLSGDFDSYSQIVNTLEYVHVRGEVGGSQLAGVLLFWVPRSIWPGKPIDTGVLVAQFKGYGFTNLSEPIWGELLINGGIVLLIVGMFVLGLVISKLDRRLDETISHTGLPGVLGCILPFYLILVLRGSLLQSMAYLAVLLVGYRVISIGRASESAPFGNLEAGN
ncbi:oligosaccharide repeat unit polymerase [Sinomonas susongensis]|uniref:oligosaccharide repeat unit polymerase n=1 Tax=Sinomonas susongensis TaxID=1324851 RepID=UPI0011084CC7|nr:oligosaccharide repeat unit polymerase [Sinomonas susongensis]